MCIKKIIICAENGINILKNRMLLCRRQISTEATNCSEQFPASKKFKINMED